MFSQPKFLFCLVILWIFASAQYNHYFVTTSNSFDATAFNNSHKIVTQNGEWLSDTLHIVYYSSDSIYYTFTTDGGHSWQTPIVLHPGIYPAFDIDGFGFRHVAWQYFDTTSGNYEIYYDCLDDWCAPINVSESPGNSILPDLVIDSNLFAHITWTEEVNGRNQIYYRSCESGVLSDTFRISDYGSAQATHSHSSISIFQPNYRVYVLWCCVDAGSYTPYHIVYRYKEGSNWSSATPLAEHWQVLRHPSLDFSHGDESLSACWEDSSSDNLETTFYGGNGGGYSTQGRSMYPVISTVGITWSYLFWQEDSAGYDDIYYHLYYEFTGGWYDSGSLRSLFNIQEPIRFPNCCGAYLVWTQGESPPYSIYFADFGYPIGIEEVKASNKSISLSIVPNPFKQITDIRYEMTDINTVAEGTTMRIYDISGRLVKAFLHLLSHISYPTSVITWHGEDNFGRELPAGTYFCVLQGQNQILVEKIVKIE